jgi:RNA binding exosome subunit
MKSLLGILGAYTAYYTVMILWDRLRHKQKPGNVMGIKAPPLDAGEKIETIAETQTETNESELIIHDTLLKSLWAYDNCDHKSMVHIRFDKQTVDLLIKFKMATGVDMTKFVAFAVKHLFKTHPELKQIIKQYLQNTKL